MASVEYISGDIGKCLAFFYLGDVHFTHNNKPKGKVITMKFNVILKVMIAVVLAALVLGGCAALRVLTYTGNTDGSDTGETEIVYLSSGSEEPAETTTEEPSESATKAPAETEEAAETEEPAETATEEPAETPTEEPSESATEAPAETEAPSENTTAETDEHPEAVSDTSVSASETYGDFTITTGDGQFSRSGSIIKITSAGTYQLSGRLEGQILVEAGDEDTVVLELCGVTITYGSDSPIKITSAGEVEISAKAGTENVVNDTRSVKTVDTDTQGEGAIYAKADLKIKGTGTLVVTGSYNNGIHTTKDLKIQKLNLKVTAYNNALKGNDSVTIKSGTVVAISTNGDGIKTENTDANKNGEVRGDITITGGDVTVYAAGDGIQAAHNFTMAADEETGTAGTLTIYTGSYSSYTATSASTTSYKGIKVQNILSISAGAVNIKSYDDGLHADYGTSFTAGGKGQGTIEISGGTVTIGVYSPEGKTMGGFFGPGGGRSGWGGQQTVSGADAIHADYMLNISGGVINIDSSYEGLEANVINISGGEIHVKANDDGINATKGVTTPQINISGGFVEVEVPASGDTDGIDSNGTYTQTGGIVIVKGPNNQNMAALEADGTKKITGGTLIILGYGKVTTGGNVKTYSASLHSSGTHTVTIGGKTYTFTNSSSYSSTTVLSDTSVS